MNKIVKNPNDRRDHMANERTFLAWIRTSIGIMAFGFVVEKFALFVRQLGHFFSLKQTPSSSESSIFGIVLVAIGALMGVFAFINYKRTERQIEQDNYQYSSLLALSVTALVLIMGIFLAIYLTSTKHY